MVNLTEGKPRSDSHGESTMVSPNRKDQTGERPVDPEEAAAFLKVARSTVLAMARTGKIPAHPVTDGRRKRWLFFLSELEAHLRGVGVDSVSHPCAVQKETCFH